MTRLTKQEILILQASIIGPFQPRIASIAYDSIVNDFPCKV